MTPKPVALVQLVARKLMAPQPVALQPAALPHLICVFLLMDCAQMMKRN